MNENYDVFADIDVDLNHFPELNEYNNYNNKSQYHDIDQFKTLNVNDKDLKVLHLNIRSLCANMDELCVLLSSLNCNFDVICITECWLNDSIEPLYSILGYTAIHSLRPGGRRGGGISVYVLHRYNAAVIQQYTVSNQTIESLLLKINHCKLKKSFIIAAVYRPPSADCVTFTDNLCHFLSEIANKNIETILCGDFNFDLFKIDTHPPTAEFVHKLLFTIIYTCNNKTYSGYG